MTGIYKIECIKKGKVYIGQAVDVERRWGEHLSKAKTLDTEFYQDIRRYGKHGFRFSVLEVCEPQDLDKKEAMWIRSYNSRLYGYNRTNGATKYQKESFYVEFDWRDLYSVIKKCRPSTLKYYMYLMFCKAANKNPTTKEFCKLFEMSTSAGYSARNEYVDIRGELNG